MTTLYRCGAVGLKNTWMFLLCFLCIMCWGSLLIPPTVYKINPNLWAVYSSWPRYKWFSELTQPLVAQDDLNDWDHLQTRGRHPLELQHTAGFSSNSLGKLSHVSHLPLKQSPCSHFDSTLIASVQFCLFCYFPPGPLNTTISPLTPLRLLAVCRKGLSMEPLDQHQGVSDQCDCRKSAVEIKTWRGTSATCSPRSRASLSVIALVC